MHENNVYKQCRFSRTRKNDYEMGAYYTDPGHCERIGRLLEFPEEEVTMLDPSIGDGKAILTVTKEAAQRKIYGVEINEETWKQLDGRDDLYVLHADFLNGIKVSNKAFSFVFANPPYGVDMDTRERWEKQFAEKIFNYMSVGGILVYVIPGQALEERFLQAFFSRFYPLCVYRFDDAEYEIFHQIVMIAKRRENRGYMRDAYDRFLSTVCSPEKLPYLPAPDDPVEVKIPVPASPEEKLEYFTTDRFYGEKAYKYLSGSALKQMWEETQVPEYQATNLGRPAVPLKKDLLYLCVVTGGGQGLAGSEEQEDLHLQRGCAKVLPSYKISKDEKKNTGTVKEQTYTKIVLNIIESSGRITTLE